MLRSLRKNKTANCKVMELISTRANLSRINRTITFRGFVPDSSGKGIDRLYTVVDSRVEKAEQNIHPECAEIKALLLWRFLLTDERYEIDGCLSTIKSHRGELRYTVWESRKEPTATEEDGQLHLRRIAWNACAEAERAAFRFPSAQDETALFPAARDKQRAVGLMRRALQALCMDPETQELRDPAEAFRAVDRDGSGTLSRDEFWGGLQAAKAPLTEEDAAALFDALEPDGGGELEYAVFSDFMRRMPVPENFWVPGPPHPGGAGGGGAGEKAVAGEGCGERGGVGVGDKRVGMRARGGEREEGRGRECELGPRALEASRSATGAGDRRGTHPRDLLTPLAQTPRAQGFPAGAERKFTCCG